MKKSNNNDRNNKENNKLNNRRSSKFDELINNQSSRPNNNFNLKNISPKERFKKIWKWTTSIIYLFLAGLGVTGFIQSCVLRTSSTVGSGVELYKSNNDIAPYVSTYKLVEKKTKEYEYDNGIPIIDPLTNQFKLIEKTYLSLEKEENSNFLTPYDDITKIKESLINNYGIDVERLYGAYDSFSSALRIIDQNGNPISNQITTLDQINNIRNDIVIPNGIDPIFMNDVILEYLNNEGISYKGYDNFLYDINLFVVARPDNISSLTDSEKNGYGLGSTNINGSFDAYEQIEGTDEWIKIETINGQYVTKDANGDGIIDSSTYVVINDELRISKFKYLLNAEVATLSANTSNLLNSEKFARDYYQVLNNVIISMSQMYGIYKAISPSFDPTAPINIQNIYEQILTKSQLENLTSKSSTTLNSNHYVNKIDQRAFDQSKLLTLEQKNAILTYQNEITSLMSKIGFGVKKQVYTDENDDNYVDNFSKQFEIEFLPNINNKRDVLLGASSTPQKAISSWGDSWRLGPFYGLIVWPLSYIINGMMGSMGQINGWEGVIAIVAAILITRVIVTLFTYKTLFSSHKQQQLNPKKAKIDAKYAPFKGNREMEQRKRQELSKLYKSNNVSMIDPLKALCISMPIFFAVWRVVQGIPDIKSTTWLGIQFSLTSWRELFGGAWQYLPLLLIAAGTQALSQYLPRILNKKRMGERTNKAEQAALKQSNRTQNIVMIVFIAMSVMFEAGVQIYWIVGGLWQITQVLIVHHIIKSQWYRTKGYKYL